ENASARVHITRLEALKLQIQQQVEVLYGNELDGIDKLMRDIYKLSTLLVMCAQALRQSK
ncbi:hypothetical protein ACTPEM_26370, partial [Clostridioides difficile]